MRYITLDPMSHQLALTALDKLNDNPEEWEEIGTQQPLQQPSVNTVNS